MTGAMQERSDMFEGVTPVDFRMIADKHKAELPLGKKGAVTRLNEVLYGFLANEESVKILAVMNDKGILRIPGLDKQLLKTLDLALGWVIEEMEGLDFTG